MIDIVGSYIRQDSPTPAVGICTRMPRLTHVMVLPDRERGGPAKDLVSVCKLVKALYLVWSFDSDDSCCLGVSL